MEMSTPHLLLALFWLTYYVFHSILAATNLKNSIKKNFPAFYPYYRACYSTFFMLTLIAILYYQLSIPSKMVFNQSWFNFLIGIPLGLVGVTMMAICIRKYFYNLSGIKVFYHGADKNVEGPLEIDGLHKMMRHPLYAGTLLFAWSIFLVLPTWSSLIMCVMMHVYLLIGIQIEEKKLATEFGSSYLQYKAKTPMLIPNFRKTG